MAKRKSTARIRAGKKPEAAGRRRTAHVGERLTRSQIALRSKIDRETVSKYLAMPGAPVPDAKMRYDYKEALAWIQKNAPRLAVNSDEMQRIRESILRLKEEDMGIDLAVKRGDFVAKETITPAIAAFCTQLTDDLRTKFEAELPPKYEGKKTIERQQLNADAIDWVLRRLKAGAASLTKDP